MPNQAADAYAAHPHPGGGRGEPVGWIFIDRSSTVTIINDMPTVSLVLKSSDSEFGTCLNAPASTIQPNGSTTMRVRDNTGPFGSKGWVTYNIGGDGGDVRIDFDCPMVGNNRVTASPSSHATVGYYSPNGPLHVEVRIH